MTSAVVTLQADSADVPLATYSVASHETGMAMASARAAVEFGQAIGTLSRTNDNGKHETLVHRHGHATVVEDSWSPAPEDSDFFCENCERPCIERSCCDNCDDCCHCAEWYCEGCNEHVSDDVSQCSNCEQCEDCCSCSHCDSCSTNVSEDSICSACDNCEDCCSCCHCTDCGEHLPEDHSSYEDSCYCSDCLPEDDSDNEDD